MSSKRKNTDYETDSGYKKGKYGGSGGGDRGGYQHQPDYRSPWEEEEDTSKYVCPEEMRSVSTKHYIIGKNI